MNLALQMLVVIMMVAVGLELTTADLVEAPRRARWFGAALVANVLVVPIAAWLMTEALALSVGFSAGIVLLAAAPGGPVGPVLARIGHADLGFSTALMVLLGLVGLVSAPLTVSLILEAEGEQGLFWPMVQALFFFQIVPLGFAMLLRHLRPAWAARVARPAGLLSNLLLVAVIASLVATRGSTLADVSIGVHAALIGLVLLILVPLLAPSGPRSVLRGLSVVTAVRNISVALLLATRFFDDPEVEAAILVWAFWMLVLPGLGGLLARRFLTKPAQTPTTPNPKLTRV